MLLVHILRDGTILVPPFPEKQIPALLRARSVLHSDHFWHEGMAEWSLVAGRWPVGSAFVAPEVPEAVRPANAAPAAPRPTPVAAEEAPAKLSRWDRVSKLQYSEKRYRATCAPWQGEPGLGPTGEQSTGNV